MKHNLLTPISIKILAAFFEFLTPENIETDTLFI